jgi:hypothetical protein
MASQNQMTGMLGVYLVAAELTSRNFIVSPTSRSAAGADLLVTDQHCQTAWSVQVKTNRTAANFWLVGAHTAKLKSPTHVYVFVNLKGEQKPDYLVVPSEHMATNVNYEKATSGSEWFSFARANRIDETEGWSFFGSPWPAQELIRAAEIDESDDHEV